VAECTRRWSSITITLCSEATNVPGCDCGLVRPARAGWVDRPADGLHPALYAGKIDGGRQFVSDYPVPFDLAGTSIRNAQPRLYGHAHRRAHTRAERRQNTCRLFPHLNPAIATIAPMGTFAAAFLSRPLGAVVFGHFGDQLGRKKTLVATLYTNCGRVIRSRMRGHRQGSSRTSRSGPRRQIRLAQCGTRCATRNSFVCAMKRRTVAIRSSIVSCARLRHSCWFRQPSSISSTRQGDPVLNWSPVTERYWYAGYFYD